MNILLALEEAAGIQTLKAVDQSGHQIVAVLTASSAEVDAKRGATVAAVAKNLGYEVWPAKKVKDPALAEVMKAKHVDILLNVHSLYIIDKEVVEAPLIGAFNLHPGPLPDYAGMNAPSWAILNGESRHGVSLHWMEAGIDTGFIAYQAMFDLKPSDTGLSVSSTCVRQGLELIKTLLVTDPDAIPRLEQDFSRRKYYGFEKPFAGKMDWTQSAESLERFVRASDFYPLPSPWGTPKTFLAHQELGVLKVALSQQPSAAEAGRVKVEEGKVLVATATDWLELKKLLVEGKALNPSELLQGGELLRARPGDE